MNLTLISDIKNIAVNIVPYLQHMQDNYEYDQVAKAIHEEVYGDLADRIDNFLATITVMEENHFEPLYWQIHAIPDADSYDELYWCMGEIAGLADGLLNLFGPTNQGDVVV